jgi:hypothetical protein
MSGDMFSMLAAPFPPERVSWRVGSTTADKKKGMALAYIDARDVMDRLDVVCGPGGWQCRYPHANGKTVCEIGIYVTLPGDGAEWIWKADGAGDTDVEAEKGALSDAFKRAAVRWGIGRYLYDLASPWVELEPMGRSFKIKDSEIPKLRKVLGGTLSPESKPERKPGIVLKVHGKSDQSFEFPAEWFAALEKVVVENPGNWTINRPTVLMLAKESDEWKALGKRIGGLAAPAAA